MHIFQGIFSIMLTDVKHSQTEVLQSIIRIKVNVGESLYLDSFIVIAVVKM